MGGRGDRSNRTYRTYRGAEAQGGWRLLLSTSSAGGLWVINGGRINRMVAYRFTPGDASAGKRIARREDHGRDAHATLRARARCPRHGILDSRLRGNDNRGPVGGMGAQGGGKDVPQQCWGLVGHKWRPYKKDGGLPVYTGGCKRGQDARDTNQGQDTRATEGVRRVGAKVVAGRVRWIRRSLRRRGRGLYVWLDTWPCRRCR